MKPITQRNVGGDDGDCLMASAASILELALDALPVIREDDGEAWWAIFTSAMRDVGFAVVEAANDPQLAPAGYTIAIGPSPRNQGTENHAVVALDGHVVHDPHPSRSGIAHIDYWLLLVPLARTPARVSPTQIDEMAL